MKTIIEPFKIKSVEPLRFTSPREREAILRKAGYNLFAIQAKDVLIDLLTDSGTTAMSARQWGGMIEGDEAYAGSRSFYELEKKVNNLTGLRHIIPTHQGRAAEKILFDILGGQGRIIPNNTHFDTTRANIELSGAEAVDLVPAEAMIPSIRKDFKGNMDLEALEALLKKFGPERIPLIMLTITNNSNAGQPVSMENIRQTAALAKGYGIPFFLDACRFAENAYFIKLRESGYENTPVEQIAREMFSYADGCTMSGKKDGLVNMGGFLAVNDDDLAQKARNILVVTEGFPTYGGLAGHDLQAFAFGLEEVLAEDYLKYRLRSIEYLGEHLTALGVPIFQPPGGHAIYIDAAAFLPHIPAHEFPGQALACELYLYGGIRSCEIGSVMFGRTDAATDTFQPAKLEMVRLAIPRRVYTKSHIDYVVECVAKVFEKRNNIKGMRIVKEPPVLRHFTAVFESLAG
ncbi:MAG: tryptophanase [Deltaproteobacteria bacterium]|jgi:tryptophanase|nr:tryptophanase [Deltaproteobacteria bacterium]